MLQLYQIIGSSLKNGLRNKKSVIGSICAYLMSWDSGFRKCPKYWLNECVYPMWKKISFSNNRKTWNLQGRGGISVIFSFCASISRQGCRNSFSVWGLILDYFRPDSNKPHLYTNGSYFYHILMQFKANSDIWNHKWKKLHNSGENFCCWK